jgi:hypothetical protein
MSWFIGRQSVLGQIDDHLRSGRHVSVVGPKAMGKTALLRHVVEQHEHGSDAFAGAGLVDFRHNPPGSTDAALQRVGAVLAEVFRTAAEGQHAYLADEIETDAEAHELYDQLKIALDMVKEAGHRVLLVLDGCDPVLQNSTIPRNLWDNLRALAQVPSLRLMTGTRDRLHNLCYNPEARTSDFFRIFHDTPLTVGPLVAGDLKQLRAATGRAFDGAAEKELANWTGGHPDLVDLLLSRVLANAEGTVQKPDVDQAAEDLLRGRSSRLEALWLELSGDVQGDIVRLSKGELLSADIPQARREAIVSRGIAVESGNKVRLNNRFVQRLAAGHESDVSGVRQLFEDAADYRANIRALLELRLAQVQTPDPRLQFLVKRVINHLPDDPGGALGSARDILDRALDVVWDAETTNRRVPVEWLEYWEKRGLDQDYSGQIRPKTLLADLRADPELPEARGRQCSILRRATGEQSAKPVATKVSKSTYVLIEHMSHLGDLKNHTRDDPTLTMAVAFCMTAIELTESLAREL